MVDVATVGIAMDTTEIAAGEKLVLGAFDRMAQRFERLNAEASRSTSTINKTIQDTARVQQEVSAAQAAAVEATNTSGLTRSQLEKQYTILLRAEAQAHAENQKMIEATTAAEAARTAAVAQSSTAAQEAAARHAQVAAAIEAGKARLQSTTQAVTSYTAATLSAAQAQQVLIAEEIRAAGGRDAYFAKLEKEVAAQTAATRAIYAKADAERAETEAFVRSAALGGAAQTGLATTARTLSTASGGATTGLRTVATTMSTVAASSIGLRGGLGSLISSLGLLSVGGGVTIAVVAGITAISAVYDKLTEASRKADEKLKGVLDSLRKTREAAEATTFVTSQAAQAAVVAKQAELTRLLSAPNRVDAKTGITTSGLDQGAIAKTRADLDELRKDAAFALNKVGEELAKTATERAAEAKRLRDRQTADTKAYLGELSEIQKVQLDNAIELAKASGDVAAIETAIHTKALANIEARVKGLGHVSEAQKELYRSELLESETLAVNARLYERLATALGTITPTVVDPRTPLKPIITDFSNTAPDQKKIDDFNKNAEESAAKIRASFTSAFESIFSRTNDGFRKLFRNIEDLAVKAAAGVAAAFAFDKLKNDSRFFSKDAKGNYSLSPNVKGGLASAGAGIGLGTAAGGITGTAAGGAAFGAASGALAGSLILPGIGTIIGGITGAVAGLISGAAKAKEAAEKMRAAQIAFASALGDFVAIANPRGALGDGLANLAKGAQALQKAAQDSVGGLDKARRQALGGGDVLKLSQGDIQKEIDRLGNNPAVASGKKYLEELLEIRKAYDANVIAIKKEIEVRKVQLGEDLRIRGLRAKGQNDAADTESLLISQARERAAIEKDLGDQYDATTQAAVEYNQALEREALAKKQATDAAKKAQDAIDLGESVQARGLRVDARNAALDGNSQDAGAFNRQADAVEARAAAGRAHFEAQQMFEAGTITADLFAQISQTIDDELNVSLRELDKAAQDSAKAFQAAADAQARAIEELNIRSLRATGQGGAADVGAQLFAQQEERRQAIEQGRSKEFLDTLDRVQTEERAAADKARQDAQNQAFLAGSGSDPGTSALPDSKTSVNLAVGTSESTSNQLLGSLRSGLVYWAYLPTISSDIKGLRSDLRSVRGLTIDDIDTGLATLGATADTVAGVVPGNR